MYALLVAENFDRELIIAEDGGTLAIDWTYEHGTKLSRPDQSKGKPLLLLAPGLGGGT